MSHLTSETQLQDVQQQIADVSRALSNQEASLAAAEQAQSRVSLQGKSSFAQARDYSFASSASRCVLLSIATTRLALSWPYVRAFSWFTLHISGNLAHRKCLMVAMHHHVQEGAHF